MNATQAAIRAGYSAKTAESAGRDCWGMFGFSRRSRQRALAKFEITRERVMLEYARLAFADPRNFNADGTLKRVPELDDDAAASLAGFEVMEEFEGAERIASRSV